MQITFFIILKRITADNAARVKLFQNFFCDKGFNFFHIKFL